MKKSVVLFVVVLALGVVTFKFAYASSNLTPLNPICAPLGCTVFGGPIIFFGPVPNCGVVVTTGLPRPMSAVYVPQRYFFNPPLPTMPPTSGGVPPGTQWAIGIVNNFNPNILCPLPIVVVMGVSPPPTTP
jgi:hypothetical protein